MAKTTTVLSEHQDLVLAARQSRAESRFSNH
jgi:hypothetical protein